MNDDYDLPPDRFIVTPLTKALVTAGLGAITGFLVSMGIDAVMTLIGLVTGAAREV